MIGDKDHAHVRNSGAKLTAHVEEAEHSGGHRPARVIFGADAGAGARN